MQCEILKINYTLERMGVYMDRLKYFGMWLLIVIAFFFFANGLIYINMHSDEIRGTVYNLVHQEQVVDKK